MKINKKGISEEGMRFNLKRLSILILFVILVAIGLIILIPRVSSDAAGNTLSNFGKFVWDVLTGGQA